MRLKQRNSPGSSTFWYEDILFFYFFWWGGGGASVSSFKSTLFVFSPAALYTVAAPVVAYASAENKDIGVYVFLPLGGI